LISRRIGATVEDDDGCAAAEAVSISIIVGVVDLRFSTTAGGSDDDRLQRVSIRILDGGDGHGSGGGGSGGEGLGGIGGVPMKCEAAAVGCSRGCSTSSSSSISSKSCSARMASALAAAASRSFSANAAAAVAARSAAAWRLEAVDEADSGDNPSIS